MVKKKRSPKQLANDRRLGQMAKRKTVKRTVRKTSSVKRRSTKRKAFSSLTPIIGAMIYGAGREKLSMWAKPITDKVPAGFGNVADNVVLGGLAYAVSKGKVPLVNKIPMLKDIAKAGVLIESAMAGQDLAGNFMGGNSSTPTAKTGSYPV